MQKGMPEAAVIWFKKGLSAPGHSEDEYQALRYELGAAYEQLGDFKQARDFYTEVYGVDVSYREVADKLSQLKGK
jgi:tetratricopeptide (TPR) repeat protein